MTERISFSTIKQASQPTITFVWPLPASHGPTDWTGAAISGTMKNTNTKAVTAITGTLAVIDGPAREISWALSAADTGTAGVYLVTLLADVGGMPIYTLYGNLTIEKNPAVTAVAGPGLVGIAPILASWLDVLMTAVQGFTAGNLVSGDGDTLTDSGIAAADVAAAVAASGNATALQGRAVGADAPTDGQMLVWDEAEDRWEPRTIPPAFWLGNADNVTIVDPTGTAPNSVPSLELAGIEASNYIIVLPGTTAEEGTITGLNDKTVFLMPGAFISPSAGGSSPLIQLGVNHRTRIIGLSPYAQCGLVHTGTGECIRLSSTTELYLQNIAVNTSGTNALRNLTGANVWKLRNVEVTTGAVLFNAAQNATSEFVNCKFAGGVSATSAWTNAPFFNCRFATTPTNITPKAGNTSNFVNEFSWPPHRLVLVMSQSGTSAPTVTTLVNTMGVSFTPSRVGNGTYLLAFTSAVFNASINRQHVNVDLGQVAMNFPGYHVDAPLVDSQTLGVLSYNAAFTATDNVLDKTVVSVEIYP